MAARMERVSGSYEKSVPDSGKGQSAKKFSKYPTSVVKDSMKKPTDKGQKVKTISEQRSRP